MELCLIIVYFSARRNQTRSDPVIPILRSAVPASAGGALASPQALDSPTRCRRKAGLDACRDENLLLKS